MKTFLELRTIIEQLKKTKSLEELARKHKVSVSFLEKQLKRGIEVETEHTQNKKISKTIALQHLDEIPDYYERLDKMESKVKIKEEFARINQTGSTYLVYLMWRGKNISIQLFFPQTSRPTKQEVQDTIQKIYPDAIILNYIPCRMDPTKPLLHSGVINGPK
jgi:hypothetical protein